MRSANSVGRGLDGRDAVDEQLGLLEDDERLLVQLRSNGDVGDFGNDVVVEPVYVVHDARLVGLQQVLVLVHSEPLYRVRLSRAAQCARWVSRPT
eukprot:scaffold129390_cov60-Phaeocystis_antarctica.AAC.1